MKTLKEMTNEELLAKAKELASKNWEMIEQNKEPLFEEDMHKVSDEMDIRNVKWRGNIL